ncbi:peptidase M61 domain-containing protein [Colletotrichum tofieldiae]|uniref:Peptidase M61 domain-containing protein n=1 Tax=Colletotrichum tofieldiae TaxID=708197 RepID=A0A166Y9Y4_9PEZI|nr:peptidase M61 domain-containing protein [Colletotrichum tofieldiae]GKT58360.1 peptidase M61 domain-containing protein [Colletotrichum tofieldiae]GKT79868.1 peptidase M61 domain-containing protein [Colletotrichum tofieldiae]GKT84442.1 peptidase M61 domain-containing protein [Colletotrichum tofieldiae]
MQLPSHPLYSLQLTPRFDADGASSLTVLLRLQLPTIKAQEPVFVFDTFYGNVPGHPFQEKDIKSTDDEGPLDIRFHDLPSQGRDQQQHWVFTRDTRGDIILRFDVFPRKVDVRTPLGARIDLRRDQGGLHGAGNWFLPQLISEQVFTVIVKWNVPADAPESTRCVWSYGEGSKPIVRVDRAKILANTVYMVGPVQSYPEVSSGNDGAFSACYWFGSLPPNLDRLKGYNTSLFPKMAAFFESSGKPYRIFMRKSGIGFGGTGFDSSYMLEYNDSSSDVTDDALIKLFTHEMVHSFAAISPEEDGYENEWFTEGIAELYSSYLPYRFGFRDKDFLIQSINDHLQGYFTNPRIKMDTRDAAEAMFNDWYAEWISYKRGFAYLLFVDLYLRKHSRSYDFSTAGPLDSIVLDLAKRNRQGETVRANEWLKGLHKYLGNDEFPVEEHFEDMLRGRHIIDFNGLFLGDPSNKLNPSQLPIMQFGFEKRSLNSRVITGLIPGSPAAAAGLWEGAHIVSTSRSSDCVEDIHQTYRIVVQDGDRTRDIDYLPRMKETAPAWQLEE